MSWGLKVISFGSRYFNQGNLYLLPSSPRLAFELTEICSSQPPKSGIKGVCHHTGPIVYVLNISTAVIKHQDQGNLLVIFQLLW